jgi:predicted  nucleic acid-binding Zn-ribbon protein
LGTRCRFRRSQEQEEQKYKDRIAELEAALKKEEEARQALEGIKTSLEKERDQMATELSTEREALEETIQSLKNLEEKRTQLTAVVKELESQVEETDKENASLEAKAKALTNEVKELKNKLADDTERLKAIEETKKQNQAELEELRKKYDVERAKLQEDMEAERKKRCVARAWVRARQVGAMGTHSLDSPLCWHASVGRRSPRRTCVRSPSCRRSWSGCATRPRRRPTRRTRSRPSSPKPSARSWRRRRPSASSRASCLK